MGTPADKKTRHARTQAHEWFDLLWKSGRMNKTRAYRYLQKIMGMTEEQAHIGKFTRDQCILLMVRLSRSEHADLFPLFEIPG